MNGSCFDDSGLRGYSLHQSSAFIRETLTSASASGYSYQQRDIPHSTFQVVDLSSKFKHDVNKSNSGFVPYISTPAGDEGGHR